jgi:hypothetical protein
MAKIRFKGPIGGISGSINGMVFADNGEQTIAYIRKPRTGEKSEAEQARDERMAEARAYAGSVRDNNAELWAFYRQLGKARKISPWALAVGDFMNVPVFRPLNLENYFGQVGDPIKIHCKDDIGLVSVEVSIDKGDGSDVERGKAAELDAREGFWVYTATQAIPRGTDIFVEVVGLDHAGHRVTLTENPVVGEG